MEEQRKERMQRNDRLRQQRFARNWRQQDLADQLGTTVLTIQRWERGTQQPSAYYRIKLSALFGVSSQDLGLIEEIPPAISSKTQEIEQAEAGPPEETAFWMIPFARNPHFTGRDEIIDQIKAQFRRPEADQQTTIRQAALAQAQAIKGLGGIGKTQTAVEYAYRAREEGRYTHTFWINAASEEAVLTSFVALAQLLLLSDQQIETDQRKLVRAALHWLEQCQQPWLMIMDNADDLAMIQPYLPHQGNGSVLLTTRASAAGMLGASIEMETMGLIEGTQFLLHRALRLSEATDEEINEASTIVMALGSFPLALDQAAAYIEETGCRLQDYLPIYEQHRLALLARRGKQATGYPDPVAATWSLSFQNVEENSPAAAELLRLCAFVAPDHIPEEMLIEGASYWPPALQAAVTDRFSFNQMLETLLAFSLVKRLSEDRLLSMHRLVQTVQMERLQPQEQRQWAEQLVQAVHTIFPRHPEDAASWSLCLRYLEQVQACDTLIQQHQLQLPAAAELLDRAGTYLRERALYSLAEPLYQRALAIWERQTLPESAGKARSLSNLAHLSFWQDKSAQAEQLNQAALRIREQQLGPEHPDVAESLHNLAGLYRVQGEYAQAEPLYQRALQIREQQLGPEHPDVAESLNGLAVLYEKLGRYAEAQSLTQQALRIREQELGPEHLLVAESLNDLAVLYMRTQEQLTKVESLFQRAARIWEQKLGPEHPMVAYPLIGLAKYYQGQREYARAEQFYVRAIHIREQQLGEMHRNLINPLISLAAVYLEQGAYEQAKALYQRALQICEQQLGPEHPLLASTLNGLANLWTRQAEYAQAEPLYQQALQIYEQQLGVEHLETAKVRFDFAALRLAQGQSEEAMHLYKQVLATREKALGPDSPITRETRERLQALLVTLGRTAETERPQEPKGAE